MTNRKILEQRLFHLFNYILAEYEGGTPMTQEAAVACFKSVLDSELKPSNVWALQYYAAVADDGPHLFATHEAAVTHLISKGFRLIAPQHTPWEEFEKIYPNAARTRVTCRIKEVEVHE